MDTRTPAEIAYDLTRLSPLPAADDDRIALAQEADHVIAADYATRRATAARLVDAALAGPLAIQIIRQLCQDEQDPRYGQGIATSYLCGGVEALIPDRVGPGALAEVYMLGRDPIDLHELARALPSLVKLMNDPRVQAAMGRP